MADEIHEGTVLWWKPELGQGAVKADSGRHFRVEHVDGVADVARGLRVRVRVDASATPPRCTLMPAASGRREFGVVDEPTAPAPQPRRATPRPASSASKRPAVSPGEGRRASTKIATPKSRLPSGAFPVGMPVHHPVHGGGFIVLSTAKVARVRFMPSEEERQVRTADLASLEGGPKRR